MDTRRFVGLATVLLLVASGGASPAHADQRDEAPIRWKYLGPGVSGVTLDASADVYLVSMYADAVLEIDRFDGAVQKPPIEGDATMLDHPRQPALGPAGEIVVPNQGNDTVAVFASDASGNVSPERLLANGLSSPSGVAVRTDGSTWTTNFGNDSLTLHAADAGPNTPPLRTIVGPSTGLNDPTDVTLGPGGQLLVSNFGGGSVTVYPADADGDVSPTRVITYSGLGGAESVVLDSSGNVYVAVMYGAVEVFTPGDDSTPAVTLTGPDTGLRTSLGLALDPDRSVTVANDEPGMVTTFAPLVPFSTPSRVRALTVKGEPGDRRRPVDWRPPRVDGGLDVQGYQVEVRRDGRTVLQRAVAVSSLVLRRSNLPTGRLTVHVRARNAQGLGQADVVGFTVRG